MTAAFYPVVLAEESQPTYRRHSEGTQLLKNPAPSVILNEVKNPEKTAKTVVRLKNQKRLTNETFSILYNEQNIMVLLVL